MSPTRCKRSNPSMSISRESRDKVPSKLQRQNVAELMEALRKYDIIIYRHIIGMINGILKQMGEQHGD